MDAPAYYLVEQEQKVGPFDLQTLQTMRDQGRLRQETLVWHDGMSDWQAASSALPQFFSSNVAANLYIATAGQRILAGLIDSCILLIPIEIVSTVLSVPTLGASYLLNFAAPVMNALYCALTFQSALQGTIGMKLLGLKAVNYNGGPPTPGQCWGRAIASILSAYAYGIGYLILFFTPRRQTLHDLIAGTLVIKTNPQ